MCREMTGQLLHYANTGSTAHHAHTWYYVTNTRDRDAMNYDVYHAYSLLYKMVYLLSSFTLFDISGNIGRKASIYPNITSKGQVSTIHIPNDLHAVYFHVNFQILFKTVWLKCTYNTIYHSLIFKLFQYTQNKKYMLLNRDNTDAS